MKEVIAKLIKKALGELDIDAKEQDILNVIETPKNPDFGDFAFPCFAIANQAKTNQHDLALEVRGKIRQLPAEFTDIQTSGPYINFFLNRNQTSIELINKILAKKERFGSQDIGKKQKALIEHTSINPNASPHVGRVRNAIIGDSIVKILAFMNFKPEVHYYVNDVSKQIAMLVLANADKLKFDAMLKKYVETAKKVEKSKKLEQEVFLLLNNLEKNDKKTVAKFKKITNTCVKGQAKILADINIKYDFFDYESKYLVKTKEILAELQKTKKLHKDKQGRLYLDQRGTVVKNKMKSPVLVLTRSDGTGLYPLRDIAYTIDKLKKAQRNIIILGEDQKLYFLQLKEALKLLKHEAPEVIHYSFVLLKSKGKNKKMATRKGDVVLLADFLNEAISKAKKEIAKRKTGGDPKKIAVGAIKYSLLKNNQNKVIVFSLDDALNFEGDTGPYLQYSYARASSIIRKAKPKSNQIILKELHDKETALIKKLSDFQQIILSAYNNLNHSLIANYSYQLAQIFNEFYHECPVIDSEQEAFRLSLVNAFRQVLKNSLNLLGIDVLEKM